MKNFRKILETGRYAAIGAGTGYGASKIFGALLRVSQRDTKTIRKFGWIFAGVTTVTAVALAAINMCRKRSEAEAYADERDADAELYVRQRRADAELYTVKMMADENLVKTKAEAGAYRRPQQSRDSANDESESISDEDASIIDEDSGDSIEPTIRQLSEIPEVGDLSYHQLAGPLLYENDIMLAYGEPHVAKTSIILNMILDIVLRRDSRLMTEDESIHPIYTGFWYNGEMTEADFQTFWGKFERKRLDDILFFIDDFGYMNLNDWLDDVEKHVNNCLTSSIFVLDNLACISNSTAKEITQMINRMKSIQNKMKVTDTHVTFIIIDHMNKAGTIAGTYKLKALFTNIVRFEAYGKGHTMITIEKKRIGHELINKSYNLQWTTAPEGNMSFENLGEIGGDAQNSSDSDDNGKLYSDDDILKFHEVLRQTGNQSEAQRQTGVPRQRYQDRIGKLIAQGKCEPI